MRYASGLIARKKLVTKLHEQINGRKRLGSNTAFHSQISNKVEQFVKGFMCWAFLMCACIFVSTCGDEMFLPHDLLVCAYVHLTGRAAVRKCLTTTHAHCTFCYFLVTVCLYIILCFRRDV